MHSVILTDLDDKKKTSKILMVIRGKSESSGSTDAATQQRCQDGFLKSERNATAAVASTLV